MLTGSKVRIALKSRCLEPGTRLLDHHFITRIRPGNTAHVLGCVLLSDLSLAGRHGMDVTMMAGDFIGSDEQMLEPAL